MLDNTRRMTDHHPRQQHKVPDFTGRMLQREGNMHTIHPLLAGHHARRIASASTWAELVIAVNRALRDAMGPNAAAELADTDWTDLLELAIEAGQHDVASLLDTAIRREAELLKSCAAAPIGVCLPVGPASDAVLDRLLAQEGMA